MMRVKPVRQTYTSKLTDLHDIYKGNTNHWSIMRNQSDLYIVQKRAEESDNNGMEPEQLPDPCSCEKPFCWSQDRAVLLRGHRSFYDVILEGLGGELPGDLSKGKHKDYNKRVIEYTPNIFQTNAKENYTYWVAKDPTLHLTYHPMNDRRKLTHERHRPGNVGFIGNRSRGRVLKPGTDADIELNDPPEY